jgi:hypothetical protein
MEYMDVSKPDGCVEEQYYDEERLFSLNVRLHAKPAMAVGIRSCILVTDTDALLGTLRIFNAIQCTTLTPALLNTAIF